MNKLLDQQGRKKMFKKLADDMNKIAKHHGIPPAVLGNMVAQMVGSPVRFK